MKESEEPTRLLILGLGNVLCRDDGLGVVAVEGVRRGYEIPDDVEVLDGGTLGLGLLSHLEGFDDLILVDAIRADQPPGSFVRIEGDEVAPAVRDRLSVHQIGVADLLDALRWLDACPRRLVLLGLVPASLGLELGRSPAVEEGLPALIETIVAEARELGYVLRPRTSPSARPDRATRALGLWHDHGAPEGRSSSEVPEMSGQRQKDPV